MDETQAALSNIAEELRKLRIILECHHINGMSPPVYRQDQLRRSYGAGCGLVISSEPTSCSPPATASDSPPVK